MTGNENSGREEARLVPMIDAHIHLDQYNDGQIRSFIEKADADGLSGLIAVSMNLDSCTRTESLAARYPSFVKPAYGFHPEQPIPDSAQLSELISWIRERAPETAAVGEIGLPYYRRTEQEAAGRSFDLQPYIEVLEKFLILARELDKPVVLHAVYEDADLVCDLLEKHGVNRAHFHWFKGSPATVSRMAERGYYISFTPDLLYEEEIRHLASVYPLELMMAETDGPWPFEGPFEGQITQPNMVQKVAAALAKLRGVPYEEMAARLQANTARFYPLALSGNDKHVNNRA